MQDFTLLRLSRIRDEVTFGRATRLGSGRRQSNLGGSRRSRAAAGGTGMAYSRRRPDSYRVTGSSPILLLRTASGKTSGTGMNN
jgi:hypothetical protein